MTEPAAGPYLIPLVAAGATDPAVAGGKAAALAQARQAGLPVLPGSVLPVSAARPAAGAASVAGASRGAGAARRAALGSSVPAGLAAALSAAVTGLGGRAIVRSSSPLEDDHRWSGAFASLNEVGPADAAAAVRSCWAAAFAPDPVARAEACGLPLDALALAVLIQPELTPDAGGLARLVDGRVQITAVTGHPGRLLGGWVAGETSWVPGEAGRPGPATLISIDHRTAYAVAELAQRVADTLGHDTIEWAYAGGAVHLWQTSRSGAPAPSPAALPADLTASGRRVRGIQSVAGDAVGRLRFVRPHEPVPSDPPTILVCERPVPALAPLLFGAAGLVSLAGPAECHLIEVARAIGVPCLVNTAVADATGTLGQINAGRWLAAIDSSRQELVVLPPGAPDPDDLPSAISRIASSLAPAGAGASEAGRWSRQ